MLSSQSSSSSSLMVLDDAFCCCDAALFSSGTARSKGSRKVKSRDLNIWNPFPSSSVRACSLFSAHLTVSTQALSCITLSHKPETAARMTKKRQLKKPRRAAWLHPGSQIYSLLPSAHNATCRRGAGEHTGSAQQGMVPGSVDTVCLGALQCAWE